MNRQIKGVVVAVLCGCLWLSGVTMLTAQGDELENCFRQPSDSARPWVYWFWLNSNITKEGITADLEAMKRAGIGGVLIMEVDQGAPVGPVSFMGDEWRALFKYMVSEAHRLGLEVNMNDDAGWNGSGGPWIKPEQSMQKVVWSETNVVGPQHFDGKLPQPETIQNFYRDITVLAFPTTGDFRIADIKGKSLFERRGIGPADNRKLAPEMLINHNRMVELTARMDKDGHLAWDVPAGRWTVLRFGHTSTGATNDPAPKSGRGLECDKLSQEGIEAQFDGMMGKLIADSKPLAGQALVATHIDSWENGMQNWTARMRKEFQKRRGYDLLPFLPTMTGRVVESMEVSERFLWDLRQTISDLVVDNYAGHMATLARQHNLRLSIEAYDGPCDDMTYAGRADEPMCEFWVGGGAFQTCKEMASAAHTYGRRIVGAESFTAGDRERWLEHPATIKALGDKAFCEGVNRFVFHRYAMQPWLNRQPGMTMGPWGLHYERTETWWEMSKPWHEYLARCQFLLRQGLPVADICYLQPETAPQGFQKHDRQGYDFDNCTAEVVLTRMTVKGGRIVLQDGMSYQVLVIPPTTEMTPQLLRKIKELVAAGATVIGSRPAKSPSLTDYPKCDEIVKKLADELWGKVGAPTPAGTTQPQGGTPTNRRFGRGTVWSLPVSNVKNPVASAQWIWFPEGNPAQSAPVGKRNFRRLLTLDNADKIQSAHLSLTADNSFELWINGQRAGCGENFTMLYDFDVAPLLHSGANILAVEAVNATETPNPAGLIGTLEILWRDGRRLQVMTDRNWEAAQQAPENWLTETSSKESWIAAMELGPIDMTPWNLSSAPAVTYTPAVQTVLEHLGVPPDFSAAAKLQYIHRRDGDVDIYFVANPEQRSIETLCAFRVTGKQPELWDAVTGSIQDAAVWSEGKDQTTLALKFDPAGSVFVVFRKPAQESGSLADRALLLEKRDVFKPLQEIIGPWTVSFNPKWGGPAEPVAFKKLDDWSKRPEDGIKYYSGTATYRTTFNLGAQALQHSGPRLILDLGRVQVMAHVKLNGQDLGILWKPPYRLDITGAVKPGDNRLEVEVVNLWINRMLGDEQLPEDSDRNPDGTLKSWPQWLQDGKPSPTGRYTFTTWRLWK